MRFLLIVKAPANVRETLPPDVVTILNAVVPVLPIFSPLVPANVMTLVLPSTVPALLKFPVMLCVPLPRSSVDPDATVKSPPIVREAFATAVPPPLTSRLPAAIPLPDRVCVPAAIQYQLPGGYDRTVVGDIPAGREGVGPHGQRATGDKEGAGHGQRSGRALCAHVIEDEVVEIRHSRSTDRLVARIESNRAARSGQGAAVVKPQLPNVWLNVAASNTTPALIVKLLFTLIAPPAVFVPPPARVNRL